MTSRPAPCIKRTLQQHCNCRSKACVCLDRHARVAIHHLLVAQYQCFLTFNILLCTVFVLDVAALQFVGRSISVFLTFNILLCTVYLCWTWLHCSCWSLNISTFSNNLTINQFFFFLYIQHSCIHTSSLPTLPTIVVETWEPFH